MFGVNSPSSSGFGGRPKLSTSPLPSYSDAVHEKHRLTHGTNGWRAWFAPFDVAIPGTRGSRRVRLYMPSPLLHYIRRRPARRRGVVSYIIYAILAVLMIFSLHHRFATRNKSWPEIIAGPPPTLVYGRSDLRRIWLWEIASGHYPSSRPRMSLSVSLLFSTVGLTAYILRCVLVDTYQYPRNSTFQPFLSILAFPKNKP